VIGNRRVLGLIPARGGSKGLPGKNILPVRGRPLIQWTIDAARQSRYIDRLVLSSDDDAIIRVARDLGCEVPFVRSADLASDTASSMDVVIDALDRTGHTGLVVLLQPTSPLRTSADIDAAIELLESAQAPACVSVRPAEEHPYWTFRLESSRLERYAIPDGPMPARRQDLPLAWCLNGAVYVADTVWLRRERSFCTDVTVGLPMPAERSIDIDVAEDLARADRVLAAITAQEADRP
jgi:CMP-N,N'-diacetyllegionaminic acid synthase